MRVFSNPWGPLLEASKCPLGCGEVCKLVSGLPISFFRFKETWQPFVPFLKASESLIGCANQNQGFQLYKRNGENVMYQEMSLLLGALGRYSGLPSFHTSILYWKAWEYSLKTIAILLLPNNIYPIFMYLFCVSLTAEKKTFEKLKAALF